MSEGPARGRDPALVPVTLVTAEAGLEAFAEDLRAATRLAIDTETVYQADGAGGGPGGSGGGGAGAGAGAGGGAGGPGALRVVSAALRRPAGEDVAWVLDVRGLGAPTLAAALDGAVADAWNAGFDAHVLDRDVFRPAGLGRERGVRWWDAQLADALLHAGLRSWYHGLAWASEHYLGVVAEGKGTTQLSYDADSDLSPAQVAYAAADAVETLWLGDVLRRCLAEAGLAEVAELEMAARPFVGELERRGTPFDRAGCASAVAAARAALADLRTTLAEVTGGGQGNLFSADVEPTWDPASPHDARTALNRWARPQVEAVFQGREGAPRLLGPADPLDAGLLGEVGGPLGEALLHHLAEQRSLAGAERLLDQLAADGRLRPRYLQVVGSPSGLVTSRSPDLGSLGPALLAHARPCGPGRAFVEVRLVHDGPAPGAPGELPARAGLAAGKGPVATAAELGRAGRADSPEWPRPSPTRLLDQLAADPRAAMATVVPGGSDAADGRPGAALPEPLAPVDWARSLRLYDELGPLRAFRRGFRDRHRRWPSRGELVAARPGVPRWVLDHEDALLVDSGGTALRWSVRSPMGRRRWFALRSGDLIRRVVALVAASEEEGLARVWRARAGDDPLPLVGAPAAEVSPLGAARRRELVGALWEASSSRTAALFEEAAVAAVADLEPSRVRAPVEMALADASLAVAAALWERLSGAPGQEPAPDVHPVALLGEAVVLECAEATVERRVDELGAAAEAALRRVVGGLPVLVRAGRRETLAP